MKQRSDLWPSMATETTWTSSASACLTAWITAEASQAWPERPDAGSPNLQNRWSTPKPTEGTRSWFTTISLRRSLRNVRRAPEGARRLWIRPLERAPAGRPGGRPGPVADLEVVHAPAGHPGGGMDDF